LGVWSKKSSSLAVSKTLKFFKGDELIEGTAERHLSNQPSPKSLASFQPDIHEILPGKFLRLASIDFSRLGPTLVMSTPFDNVPLTLYDATVR
jgi:hypothetical protein